MIGCADDVSGATEDNTAGKVSLSGKRVGETNGLQ
jgi:hypothetical protein